jgi:hypothetical protein
MSTGVYCRNLAKNAGILKFIFRRMIVCPDPRVLLGPEWEGCFPKGYRGEKNLFNACSGLPTPIDRIFQNQLPLLYNEQRQYFGFHYVTNDFKQAK